MFQGETRKNYSKWFLISSCNLMSFCNVKPMKENLLCNRNIHKWIPEPMKGKIKVENPLDCCFYPWVVICMYSHVLVSVFVCGFWKITSEIELLLNTFMHYSNTMFSPTGLNAMIRLALTFFYHSFQTNSFNYVNKGL